MKTFKIFLQNGTTQIVIANHREDGNNHIFETEGNNTPTIIPASEVLNIEEIPGGDTLYMRE